MGVNRGIRRLNRVDLLLVEDNPGDVDLVKDAFRESGIPHNLLVANDGEQAMALLRERGGCLPQLILLDLNLPRKSGLEVLSEIKEDERLKQIPVIVVTTSISRRDIVDSYDRHANCYITKPVDFDQLMKVLMAIGDFWLNVSRFRRADSGVRSFEGPRSEQCLDLLPRSSVEGIPRDISEPFPSPSPDGIRPLPRFRPDAGSMLRSWTDVDYNMDKWVTGGRR